MNRKKKIIIGSLVFIVIIIILCVFGYLIYREKYNKTSNTIDQGNNKAELSTELKEQEAILIREQFLAKLKEIDKISDEKLLDYRVDEVKILSDSEKQVFNENEEYSPEDILAFVKYSVKPKDIEHTVWIAGNGKLVKESGFSTAF